eukprot:CAMPEP_0114984566 /NCGR_PEP_ID=MMETSP0216-20121206/7347_1 /TAXON_ID=223996 /ORGANISM="Protocruzia adherens, Strain Boccale" /LENGTH=109 /DNA_ID=CAMNT_0002346715 /DNA_START=506 /DNA_END=835 /DNA_ORIENTATION=-
MALFLSHLFKTAEILKEEVLLALILIERMLKRTEWKIRAGTWRPVVLVAVRLASKIHSGTTESLYNYPLYSSHEFAELERIFLAAIDYRVFVSFEDYSSKSASIMASLE